VNEKLLASFLAKVDFPSDPRGCWIWTAGRNSAGYGKLGWREAGEKFEAYAHRLSYEHFIGPIEKPQLHHRCEQRACVNPWHLEPVTQLEHSAYSLTTHCSKGHPRTPENTDTDGHCAPCRRARIRMNRTRLRFLSATQEKTASAQ